MKGYHIKEKISTEHLQFIGLAIAKDDNGEYIEVQFKALKGHPTYKEGESVYFNAWGTSLNTIVHETMP